MTLGYYSCKSYLNWLINDVSLADFLPSKTIQNASIPPKIQVFLWALAQGKLNWEVIQIKLLNMCLSPSWSVMCKTSIETSNHLFFHCFVASKLWNRLCKEANISWVIPGSYHSILLENSYVCGKRKKAKTL